MKDKYSAVIRHYIKTNELGVGFISMFYLCVISLLYYYVLIITVHR